MCRLANGGVHYPSSMHDVQHKLVGIREVGIRSGISSTEEELAIALELKGGLVFAIQTDMDRPWRGEQLRAQQEAKFPDVSSLDVECVVGQDAAFELSSRCVALDKFHPILAPVLRIEDLCLH